MHILRIVDRNGIGLYRGLWQATIGSFNDPDYHPYPENDAGILQHFGGEEELDLVIDRYLFGFGSPSQIDRWIHNRDWWKMFADKGGMVRILKVRRCVLGDSQVMFESQDAEVVDEIPCSEFCGEGVWELLKELEWVAD